MNTRWAAHRPPLDATGVGDALAIAQAQFADGLALAMHVKRDPSRNDVTLEAQVSGDLAQWTTVATSTAGAPFAGAGYVGGDADTAGVKTVELRDPAPTATPQRFMRLRVTW